MSKIPIPIDNDYFVFIEKEQEQIEKEELKKKVKDLEERCEKLENRNMELLKLMNELLKINIENPDENYEEIKKKMTSIIYREIRLKHTLPFSHFISSFGISKMK